VPIKGLEVSGPDQSQRVVLFASAPLTDEKWQPLKVGELLIASDGVIIS
jgi:predicted glutamine amidotransferase